MLWERIAIFIFGVVFVAAILVLAFLFPNPTNFQYEICRIVLALACAGVATLLSGFLEFEIPKFIKAGGALAVFVIVYFYSPASLVVDEVRVVESIRSSVDKGWNTDAEFELSKSLQRFPKNPDLHNLKGQLNLQTRNYLPAANSFSQAIEFARDELSTNKYIYNRASALILARKYAAALKDLTRLKPDHSPDPAIHFNLGLVQSRLGHHKAARASFTNTLRLDTSTQREFAAEVELQRGVTRILECGHGGCSNVFVDMAIKNFRDAVCKKSDLRQIFLNDASQIELFHYSDEKKIISGILTAPSYIRFRRELADGKLCWGNT